MALAGGYEVGESTIRRRRDETLALPAARGHRARRISALWIPAGKGEVVVALLQATAGYCGPESDALDACARRTEICERSDKNCSFVAVISARSARLNTKSENDRGLLA